MAKKALMVQDDKGNLYFLRPEILAAAKLPRALHKDARVALKAAKRTLAPKLKVVGALGLVRTSVPRNQDPARPGALSARAARGVAVAAPAGGSTKTPTTSTIMCPW
jgi:hypothetical protein